MLAKFDKPPACADCSLETLGKGFAPAAGPAESRILFVGEALGYQEAMAGAPFIGAAGGMFSRLLNAAEISRDVSRVHNCVNCQPPGDWLDGAPWQHSALTHCRGYLQESLNAPHLQVVVTLGAIPLRQVLDLWGVDGIRVQDFHGTVHRDPTDRYWVVPTYHPSFLQRGAINLFDVVRFDLSVAKGILRQGGYPRRPVSLLLDPPVAQCRAWVDCFTEAFRADPGGIWLAVDIETKDKEGGRDEGELTTEDRSTEITRINFSCNGDEGLTVPYVGPYIQEVDRLLSLADASAGTDYPLILLMWNKGYDEPRLRIAGHGLQGTEIWDLMWAAHHLQSDYPLGLGFWAPFCSDYGAWKHLGKQAGKESEYAAVDGLQTFRIGHYIIPKLITEGLWEAFYRHTHIREQVVLRPCHEVGIGVDIPRLDQFHLDMQTHSAALLERIKSCETSGSLRPKLGYRDRPEGPPPKSVIGNYEAKGDHAKAEYIATGLELVQREIGLEIKVCRTCGKRGGVGPKHNCLAGPKRKKGRSGQAADASEAENVESSALPHPDIVTETIRELRWFYKLPFNPDANAQILQYITDSGEQPGKAKKTRKPTANKETLRKLAKRTGDPLYQFLLDYKAVKKVDSTYALGAKRRLWADGRLHPVGTFRPSTFRDSYVNPNIQNVVTDRGGKESLAAGFRNVIVAADTEPEWARDPQDPTGLAPTAHHAPGAPAVHDGTRLLEVDYSGIEGVETGWLCGDPDYIRLATLGIHAYLTSYLIDQPASLSWTDSDLADYFAQIKKQHPVLYDKAKRTVHGNNYGLTVYGMVENFPEVFENIKEATRVQEMYYALAPKLPAMHKRVRQQAYDQGYLGGPWIDDYFLLAQGGKNHPYSYKHYFWGVMTYRPLSEADYRKLQWIAKNRMKLDQHPRVVIMHNRPFEAVMGEDSKRVIAFGPQSIAAGRLKEAELDLFHPGSDTFIGDAYYGRTPLRAPIHDSLLMEIPKRSFDLVASIVIEVMRRPELRQPCPAEWNIGSHLRVNVAAKTGMDWGHMEDLEIPDMPPATASEQMYLPVEEDQYEDVLELGTRMVM